VKIFENGRTKDFDDNDLMETDLARDIRKKLVRVK